MLSINQNNFEKEVVKSDKIVVIDFHAPWCMPCQMMGPSFEAASQELTNLKFVKVNIQENQSLGNKFMISGIPTIVLMKDGEEIGRFSGFRPKDELIKEIKEIIMNA